MIKLTKFYFSYHLLYLFIEIETKPYNNVCYFEHCSSLKKKTI